MTTLDESDQLDVGWVLVSCQLRSVGVQWCLRRGGTQFESGFHPGLHLRTPPNTTELGQQQKGYKQIQIPQTGGQDQETDCTSFGSVWCQFGAIRASWRWLKRSNGPKTRPG